MEVQVSNLLITLTESEEPLLFLTQNKSIQELTTSLRTEQLCYRKAAFLYELKPDPLQLQNSSNLTRLRKVCDANFRSPAEQHLQAALYYARINAAVPELEVLGKMLKQVHSAFTEAKARKELHLKELLNPPIATSAGEADLKGNTVITPKEGTSNET